MKLKIKDVFAGFSGNMDDMVIYYNSNLQCLIARKKPKIKSKIDGSFGQDIFAFARRIELSEAYKRDCADYIKAYNIKNSRNGRAQVSWPTIWMTVMRAQFRELPKLNIHELTREEAIAQNLNFISIAHAVDARYLEQVRGYENRTRLI